MSEPGLTSTGLINARLPLTLNDSLYRLLRLLDSDEGSIFIEYAGNPSDYNSLVRLCRGAKISSVLSENTDAFRLLHDRRPFTEIKVSYRPPLKLPSTSKVTESEPPAARKVTVYDSLKRMFDPSGGVFFKPSPALKKTQLQEEKDKAEAAAQEATQREKENMAAKIRR